MSVVKQISLVGGASLLYSAMSVAAPVLYHSETDFVSASSSASLTTQSFEMPDLVGKSNSARQFSYLDFGDVSVVASGDIDLNPIFRVETTARTNDDGDARFVSDGVTSITGAPGGYYDRTYDRQWSPLTFNFDTGINLLGFDYLDFATSDGPSDLWISLDGSDAFRFAYSSTGSDDNEGRVDFGGLYTGTDYFTSITFLFGEGISGDGTVRTDDLIGFDRFQFGLLDDNTVSVSAPSTVALFGLGLMGLMIARRNSKS